MRADLGLKIKQSFWETPRNIVVIVGVTVTVAGVVAGLAGYKLGQNASPAPTQIIFQPGSIVAAPAGK